jgi:hypothetical protein
VAARKLDRQAAVSGRAFGRDDSDSRRIAAPFEASAAPSPECLLRHDLTVACN